MICGLEVSRLCKGSEFNIIQQGFKWVNPSKSTLAQRLANPAVSLSLDCWLSFPTPAMTSQSTWYSNFYVHITFNFSVFDPCILFQNFRLQAGGDGTKYKVRKKCFSYTTLQVEQWPLCHRLQTLQVPRRFQDESTDVERSITLHFDINSLTIPLIHPFPGNHEFFL